MNRQLALKVISTDAEFVSSLQSSDLAGGDATAEGLQVTKGPATHVPGAVLGWWEIAVGIGLTAAPIAVITNVLATWIGDALLGKKPRGETKVILRSSDGRVSEVRVSSADRATIAAALEAALQNVDRPE